MNDDPAAEGHESAPVSIQAEELARLQAELTEYQDLIEELPVIYEAKFNHQVRDVAQDIRNLMDERQRLHQQINACLLGSVESSPAPSVGSPSASSPLAGFRDRFGRLSRGKLALAATSAAVVLSLPISLQLLRPVVRSPDSPPAPSVTPAPASPDASPKASPAAGSPPAAQGQPSAPRLGIRARGEVWLAVRAPDQRPIFEGTLQPGQELTFQLNDGMGIRSGRPHLLDISLANQSFRPLGAANDFRWRTLRHPQTDADARPGPVVRDQAS